MLMVVGSWVPCFPTSSFLKATYVTDYTSSDGLQLVEQTDLGEKTGYVIGRARPRPMANACLHCLVDVDCPKYHILCRRRSLPIVRSSLVCINTD